MSQLIHIRAARIADAETIAAFQISLAAETESLALDAATVAAGVRAVFERETGARYFVAEIDGRVVGVLMTTQEWSDWRGGYYRWLQSVYVEPGSRRRGVFTSLLNSVRDESVRDDMVIGLRLYREHDNDRANATYVKLGFRPSGHEVMEHLFND